MDKRTNHETVGDVAVRDFDQALSLHDGRRCRITRQHAVANISCEAVDSFSLALHPNVSRAYWATKSATVNKGFEGTVGGTGDLKDAIGLVRQAGIRD